MQDGYVSNGSTRLAYRDSSTSGRDIVLCHGVFANLEYFEPLASQLSLTNRIVSYDLRGHGWSGSGPTTLRDHADDLRALIAALELVRPLIIGVSYGAFVALEAASWPGSTIGGLVNVDGPLIDRTDADEFRPGCETWVERREQLREWIESRPDRCWSGSADELAERLHDVSLASRAFEHRRYGEIGEDRFELRPDPDTCAEMILTGYAPLQYLYRRLAVPYLVIVGRQSGAIYDSVGERQAAALEFAKQFPQFDLRWIDGPHDLVANNLDDIVWSVSTWLHGVSLTRT